MKRSLWALVLPVFLFVFSACGDTYNDTYIVDSLVDILNRPIRESQWEYSIDDKGFNPYYYYDMNVPELTQDIYENGLVSIYMYLDPNNYNAGYVPLVDSFPYEEEIGSLYYNWTEHYTYMCFPGKIRFIAITDDFGATQNDEWYPPTQVFRIVLNLF